MTAGEIPPSVPKNRIREDSISHYRFRTSVEIRPIARFFRGLLGDDMSNYVIPAPLVRPARSHALQAAVSRSWRMFTEGIFSM